MGVKMKKVISILFIFVFIMIMLTGCSKNSNIDSNSKTSSDENINLADKKDVEQPEVTVEKAPEVVVNKESKEDILLKKGDRGSAVVVLQKKLFNIGYDLSIDGSYGSQVTGIISKFQLKSKIKQTGNYNSSTKELLYEVKNTRDYDKILASKTEVTKESTPVKAAPAQVKEVSFNSLANVKTNIGNSEQVLVVLADKYGTYKTTYSAYEKKSGKWTTFSSGNSVIGKSGFSDNRKEGDMTTPIGKYGFPFMFGTASNPGVKFQYRKVVEGDYWVSNNIISEYNVWMYYTGSNLAERFQDYEELWTQPLYKYAAVIDFNYYSNKQLGLGSGIFLHIAPYSGYGTAGCVAMKEAELVKILKWLDPGKKPVIVMGVKGHI